MASSSSSSPFSMVSRMRNCIRIRQQSDVSESFNPTSSFGRTTEVLTEGEVIGRLVSYEVFISHRGSDAKKDAAQIHEDLKRLGVNSFFDTEGIFKGENLSAVIVKAINSSTVLLVILTKGFAESSWCLEELMLMLKKVKEDGNMVVLVPVFLGVEPEDLRDVSRGPFLKAFKMHKKGKEFSSRIIKNWEETLKEVAAIPGPRLSDFNSRKENLFKALVQDVVKRVRSVDMETPKFPVAVDEKVLELNFLINYAKSLWDTPCVLVRGMTGIGKTTVAKQYFNIFRSSFKSACFVESIRVKAKSIGLVNIQKMILKELVMLDADVHNVNEGIKLLKKRLQGVEVLLILDDVDDIMQLNALMVHEVLSPGSVVMVTTTEGGHLSGFVNNWCNYEVNKLDRHQSRELLLKHAMQQQESTYPELDTLIEEYLDLCDGLPLSLEVVGRSLAGVTSKYYWKNTLAKFSDILPSELKRKFQFYFDNLNQAEMEVVISIACVFDGEDCDLATCFWDASGIAGEKILDELVLKSIVDFNSYKLLLHPQLKLYIVQALDEENRKDPRHIKHLWRPRDVRKTLEQNPGPVNLEFLSLVDKGPERSSWLDLNGVPKSNITWREYENDILGPWPMERFAKMRKLKFLMLEDACVVGEHSRLPYSILWLRWRFYPYNILPVQLPISNLRVLELDGGKMSSLWETKKLTEIPLQLRYLYLQGCAHLESLPVSIGMLKHLQLIVLKGCVALTSLPDEICNAHSLKHLDFSGCSGLEYLPSNIGNLNNLQFLGLSGCVKLVSLPTSFSKLIHMISLNLNDCKKLVKIPHSWKTLSELRYLILSGCGLLDLPRPQASQDTIEALDLLNTIGEITSLLLLKLSISGCTNLPGNFGQLSLLTELYIRGPDLVELPLSLGDLSSLTHLMLDCCWNLKYLVHSIGKLKRLKNLSIHFCGLLELPDEIGELCNLEILLIHDCENLKTLPSTINKLSTLLHFELVGNARILESSLSVSHNNFSNPSLLRKLVLDGCEITDKCLSMISKFCQSLTYLKLQSLPISHIKITEHALHNLESLSIVYCNSLTEVEVFPKLRMLEIIRCLHLKCVSVPKGTHMWWLRELTLNHCPELTEVLSIDKLQYLEKIDTVGCENLHYLQGLERILTLKEMHIFITYWGFHYQGDEWLQKLQRHIYAPAMHFATKTVLNKDEMFENFYKMDKISSHSLTFQLPESTISCAWVMVAFLSYDSYENKAWHRRKVYDIITDYKNSDTPSDLLPKREGQINLTLCDGTNPLSIVHEYRAAEVSETIHFSIFTGDFWLCEQLKSGRIINISSSSPCIELRSGWVRMLSMEEESNIEAIQCEFFEQLRKEKETNLRFVLENREIFFALYRDWRRERNQSSLSDSEEEQDTVGDALDLNICARSVEDMKDFQALDVANCKIVRLQFLLQEFPIRAEFLAPTWKKKQALYDLQEHGERLSPLHLEISGICRRAVDSAVVSFHTTNVEVTVRENYSFPHAIRHKFHNQMRSLKQASQENSDKVYKVVLAHHDCRENLKNRNEEALLKEEFDRTALFYFDENGPGVFVPQHLDSGRKWYLKISANHTEQTFAFNMAFSLPVQFPTTLFKDLL